MTALAATSVVYDLGDLAAWVSAGLTLAAVVTALVVAGQDRRVARREAADRWELEQLTRLAVLTAHGGIPSESSPEMKAQESERGAERLVLRWMLGGPERFPLGLRADKREVVDLAGLRRARDDASSAEWVRQRAESALLACEAADKYRRARGGT